MHIVTVIRDTYEAQNGVEVAGIFDTEEKACKAKQKIVSWMKDNDYEDYTVFVYPMNINQIKWYDVEEYI